MPDDLDKTYEKLRKDGHATVENIVKWMQDAKLLEKAAKTKEEAAQMFAEVKDTSNVEKEKFMEVIHELAEKAKITNESMYKSLVDNSANLLEALKNAAAAFSATLSGTIQPQTSK